MQITKTRQSLIQEVADKLNIVGTGQSLEAEYAEKIDNNIDPLLLQLASDGICNVGNDEAIPSEWFDSIAMLLANICAPLGGKNFDPGIKEYGEKTLRRLTASPASFSVLQAEYF